MLLRMTVRMVRMTEEEQARITAENTKSVFDPTKLRALVPTAGGPNALVAARLALWVARTSAYPVTVLFIDRAAGKLDWLRRRVRPPQAGTNLTEHFDQIRAAAQGATARTATADPRNR